MTISIRAAKVNSSEQQVPSAALCRKTSIKPFVSSNARIEELTLGVWSINDAFHFLRRAAGPWTLGAGSYDSAPARLAKERVGRSTAGAPLRMTLG